VLMLFIVWIVVHQHMLTFGTNSVPLHKTHIGDEQSPVNAGLHILKDKSIFSIRESGTYYGPTMAFLSVPAAISNLSFLYVAGHIKSVEEYRDYIVWDWGGIVYNARFIALVTGFIGIILFFLLMREFAKINDVYPAFLGSLLLATNLLYFVYASFFRVWIFIVVILLWQLYIAVLIEKGRVQLLKGFVLSAFLGVLSFGLNYVSLVLQVFWLPYVYKWFKCKDKQKLVGFSIFIFTYLFLAILVIGLYPDAFFRIVNMGITSSVDPNAYGIAPSINETLYYYGALFITGNSPLLIAFGILLVSRYKIASSSLRMFLLSMFFVGLTYATLILAVGWKEGRYALPLSLLLVLATSLLLSIKTSSSCKLRNKFLYNVVLSLIVTQIAFGTVIILKFNSIYTTVPSEIEVIQTLKSTERIVVIRSRFYGMNELVGVAHSEDSYKAYFKSMGLQNLDYYKYLMETNPRPSEDRFNIYYTDFDKLVLSQVTKNLADHFIYCYNPLWEGSTGHDPFETNVFQLWHPDNLLDECFILK